MGLKLVLLLVLAGVCSALAAPETRRAAAVSDEDRRHWSYLPLRTVEPPSVNDAARARTPIDRFILRALESRGLRPNGPADRRTLIRRVYFDLAGLPPTPQEVAAFVADPAPDAYDKLVDRLLASPHFGERWGRHWLDVARYADSDGMESDGDRPTAWRYRDFVIKAFNDDLPYDTFVRWQLAGDEFEPDDPRALAATGFLAAAPTETGLPAMEDERLRLRFSELDDLAGTTASAFLGLTLACARCHDHKYDAIPTRDYYRLQCAFTTTERREVPLATRAEVDRFRATEAAWQEKLKAAEGPLNDWLAEQKKTHPEAVKDGKLDRNAVGDEARARWDVLKAEVDAVRATKPNGPPTALAVVDKQPEPEPTWLLERGDFHSRKEVLRLGFLTVLTNGRTPEQYLEAARGQIPPGRSTGQRRALAEWMTDVDHGAGALLARVIVNRVWQHHFGEGLVRTVGDFGVRGEAPTHPELLEHLAHELVAGGWRLKALHRAIVTSSVYTQAADFDAERAKLDPDNRLLWRRRPQRLEAEALRDAMLAVSGTLNPEPYGPAFKPPIPPEAMQARNTKSPYPSDARDTPATRRRSVYMFHKRVVQHPFLQAFDGPDATTTCGRRSVTTVAPQALALLNDVFVRDRASDFARRMLADGGESPEQWARRAFWLALSRAPSDEEQSEAVGFINAQVERHRERDKSLSPEEVRLKALTDFCQALFALNEFIYVD